MSEPEKKQRTDNRGDANKTELANRIASQSKRMDRTYQTVSNGLIRIFRWFSTLLDKTLFNPRYTRLVSLILAIVLYLIVNYNTNSSLHTTTLQQARSLNAVTVTANYNSDIFELDGLPATADITITGDASSVTAAAASGGVVVADLEGLTEGTHEVKLEAQGFGSSVSVKIDPSNVILTLKKKTTRQFDVSYDFINRDKMDSIYSLGTPQFEYTKVNVRAAKDTLDSIAFIKALIDVSGQTADFTQEAKLVAYDVNGQPVTADIVPGTVSVTVPVTSPNKTVPIEVEVTGEVPDGMAIASITTDQQSVTIYGSEAVLGQIDKVVVSLNASSITKDTTIMRPITLPSGVTSSSINQITMNVTLGEGVSKTIDGVNINYRNNVNNYKASAVDKTTTSVVVFGTQENIDSITASDIDVYVDMQNAMPGVQDFPLEIEQPEGGLVRYSLTESTYTLNVLGETNDNTGSEEGADVNNG
ncbi:MAG: CdaR family protein [Galactobacillus timonensis]|uniref:CdaR family protein n=1 Tax=Galactobacillus timonensis TaxID=2041840 RepID=UPI0023F54E3D|nr:CdaR family protein [Galactobacillus timonensis]MCI6067772.1 CdaR family protein [Galactobacillus timonensis]MCI6753426.1 CdaR family protein [Galactobacillus timonensis]MDD7086883.1 CdaR family protein [Galactobacillus timonensis]MDY5222051.1 CdaR family protein [Lachnospiraceae bacterium]